MRFARERLLAAAVVGLAASAARADVKPHPLFTDNMVLQQGAKAAVYGTAEPDEKVQVTINLGKLRPSDPTATFVQQVSRTESVTADRSGNWKLEFPAPKAAELADPTAGEIVLKGAKNTVTLKNVAVGEVWVCSGQSNMEWTVNADKEPGKNDAAGIKAAAANPKLRLFTVVKKVSLTPLSEAKDLAHLQGWKVSGPDTVGSFSAVGYHFGQYLQKNLPGDVPVGLIHTSWGGTPAEAWTSKEALDAAPELKYYHERLPAALKAFDPAKAEADFKAATEKWKTAVAAAKAAGKTAPNAPRKASDPRNSPNSPSSLYNAMIHPLLGYPVRGAIWYQGESNSGKAFEYRTLLATLINDWRAKWKSDLPFMVVQLAPFMAIDAEPKDSAWAELREAQFLATKRLPKVGLAVITDVGNEKDIHPTPKKPVGDRLAVAALAIEYGQKVEPIGPTFKSLSVEGDKAVVTFDHLGGGLVAKGEKLTGFAVAGDDKKFHAADAEIKGDTVVVSSKAVPKPAAVRFGWANYPVVNLWGKDGLPAVPFRTDDYPMVTAPKPPTTAPRN